MSGQGALAGRICFVAPSAFVLGGIATWLDYLVPGLRARGWDVQVVLTAGEHHDASAYRARHPEVEPVILARSTTGTREGRVRELVRVLSGQAPGVVVAVNIPDAIIAASRLKQSHAARRVPAAVLAVHGLEPQIYADVLALAPALDAVVCSNRLSCALAHEAGGFDDAQVHYAPYGVPSPINESPRQADRPLLRIGFAGRFERFQKRPQDLLAVDEALHLAEVQREWILAGAGPDAAAVDDFERRARARVRRLGVVDAREMDSRFFARCDVLFNPSEWETGPIVIWEAMARGVPVASSRYVGSGLEAALEHGRNCMLHDVGDCRQAARNIADLSDGALRSVIVAGGNALIATRYAVDASVSAWSLALESVASVEPRAGALDLPAVAGRLDRVLGIRMGEHVRGVLRRRARVRDSGDEWPHTLAQVPRDDPAFWARAASLDTDACDGRGAGQVQRP